MYTLRKIPLIRVLIPFAIGILLALQVELPEMVFMICCAASGSLYLFSVFTHYRHKFRYRFVGGLALSGLLLSLGGLLVCFQQISSQRLKEIAAEMPIVHQWELAAPPIRKAKGLQLEFYTGRYLAGKRLKALVFVNDTAKNSETAYRVGDLLQINSKLKIPDAPKNPLQFNYREYLIRQGIYFTGFAKPEDIELVRHSSTRSLIQWSFDVRSKIVQRMEQAGLNGQELAIAGALVIGEEKNLDPEIRSAYAASGAMHVLSVSGLHIGIVYLILKLVLAPLLRKASWKKWLIPLIILLLWVYSFITGLSPCVQRAALMFSFVAIGDAFGRRSNIYNMLGASAFLLLLIDPLLMLDVGFQLSYLALLGIVLLQQPVTQLIYVRNKWLYKVWELTAVAIAAQLATGALSIYYFHQFPNYFLLANLLVIPLSFVILVIGVGFIALCWLPYVSELLGWLLKWSVWLLNNSLLELERIPGSVSKGWFISVEDCWFSYFLLASLLACILLKSKWFLKVSLLIALSWIGNDWLMNDRTKTSATVYCHKGRSAIGLFGGSEPALLGDPGTVDLGFIAGTHLCANGLANKKPLPITCHSQLIKISDGNEIILGAKQTLLRIQQPPNPKICPAIRFNYLLIESSLFNWSAITQFTTEKVVLGNGLSYREKRSLTRFLLKRGIVVQDINVSGSISLE